MERDLEELRNDILREMYEEAKPPLDFDEVLRNPSEFDDDWYSNHYLPQERQWEIYNRYAEEHDLTKREKMTLDIEVIMNLSPSTAGPEG